MRRRQRRPANKRLNSKPLTTESQGHRGFPGRITMRPDQLRMSGASPRKTGSSRMWNSFTTKTPRHEDAT